jgi:hypothetical protein
MLPKRLHEELVSADVKAIYARCFRELGAQRFVEEGEALDGSAELICGN